MLQRTDMTDMKHKSQKKIHKRSTTLERSVKLYVSLQTFEHHIVGASKGFWGSGENGYLFSGSLGALVISLGELGSKLIILGI